MATPDENVIDSVLAMIGEGKSVRESCEAFGIPRTTFLKYVDRDQYARAREACADVQFDEMTELERRVLDGKQDPNAFRVAMDARKWRLGRMRPTVYGDKVSLEHSGSIDLAKTLDAARKRRAGE